MQSEVSVPDRHALILGRVAAHLGAFLETHRLGHVVTNTAFELRTEPNVSPSADVAFLRNSPSREGVPDVVFEIVTSAELFTPAQEKNWSWIDAGVRDLFVIFCDDAWVLSMGAIAPRVSRNVFLHLDDSLTAPDLLPGWSLPLRELFA